MLNWYQARYVPAQECPGCKKLISADKPELCYDCWMTSQLEDEAEE